MTEFPMNAFRCQSLTLQKRGPFCSTLEDAGFDATTTAVAVERLRGMPAADGSLTVLASTDPASPWGAMLPWPKLEGGRRAARTPGSFIVSRDGNPLLYVEKGGRGLLRLDPSLEGQDLADCLAELVRLANEKVIPALGIERFDGGSVFDSDFESLLTSAGFARRPRKLVAPS